MLKTEEYGMRLPKLLVLITVYGMCAIGMVILWSERRKTDLRDGDGIADDSGLPAYK
jgi:hypothetical protein